MTTCITILGIITCTLNPQATKLSPTEAATILAPGQYVHVPRYPAQPPAYLFVPPNAPAPAAMPGPSRYRLDGSLHSDPPWQHTSFRYSDLDLALLTFLQTKNQPRDQRQERTPRAIPTPAIMPVARSVGKLVRSPQ